MGLYKQCPRRYFLRLTLVKEVQQRIDHIYRGTQTATYYSGELRKAYVQPPGKKADERARSKFTSNLWNNMSREEKAPWREKARLIKEAHKIKYPDYRYKPKRNIPAKEAFDLRRKRRKENLSRKEGSIGPTYIFPVT